jgi:hypothetical protein
LNVRGLAAFSDSDRVVARNIDQFDPLVVACMVNLDRSKDA